MLFTPLMVQLYIPADEFGSMLAVEFPSDSTTGAACACATMRPNSNALAAKSLPSVFMI
jgi:hypothetical protein